MKLVGPALWFMLQGILYSGILYIIFGLATTLFSPEFYFMIGFTIAAFSMIAGADREAFYDWIDKKLDKLSGSK